MGFAMVVAKDIKQTLRPTKVHRPVSVPQTSNTFLPLSADDASSHEIPSSSMMHQLNSWAHKVKVRGSANRHGVRPSTQVSRSAAQKLPVISSEKDLDKALKAHPHLLSAMPTDRKRIAKASKMTPDRLMLRDGEMWAMMDSGAGVPGINVVKHCPELAFALKEAVRRKRCICANGGEMLVDKEIKLNVELDGHAMPIKFSELPVQCPILSVRRIVRKGNDIVFTEDGGYIQHRTSGR